MKGLIYSLEILALGRLFEISAWGGVLIGSRILDWGGALLKLAQQKKLKEKVTHMKELCYHMEIEITGMRKKLLSCTNSSVVYTWKVVNKVVVEKGFPCVPIICKSEGGEWGGGGEGCLFKRGACLTLWPSKWVLIWGVVLFTTWALICQAFSRAWSMSINSQSLFFSRKIDNRIRHLGWACEHNLNPSPPGDLNSQS